MWITGKHPVEELFASASSRPKRVFLSDALPADERRAVERLASKAGVPCTMCSRDEWARRTGEREGGVAAEIEEYRYVDLHDWLPAIPETASAFLLDGITDPQNFGAILRSARAFGLAGVIVPKDRSCPVTPAVFRASAGTAAHVSVIQVTNLVRAMEEMKEAGFWIYAAREDGETVAAGWKPAPRTAVVLGSEEKGIRRLVSETCDGSVRIAMTRGIDSLNVSVAAGILAFCLHGGLTSVGKSSSTGK